MQCSVAELWLFVVVVVVVVLVYFFLCTFVLDLVGGKYLLITIQIRKALPGFFLCIFSSLTCLKKPVFSKRELLRWKVPARL